MTGTVPSTAADIAIAHVQADQGFRNFPNAEGRTGCVLGAGLRLSFKGTCQTRVSRTGRSTVVTFTEFWPAAKFGTGGPPIGMLHHSWNFEIRADGRIVSAGEEGSFPPDYAR